MEIEFDNLSQKTVSFSEFPLSWRFESTTSQEDLEGFLPLSQDGSVFLSKFLKSKNLHDSFPFRSGIFKNIELFNTVNRQSVEVRDWLSSKLKDPDKAIYLHWDLITSAIVTSKTFVKYYDDFRYLDSDDLTVFDKELNWAFLFFHTGQIYFGET